MFFLKENFALLRFYKYNNIYTNIFIIRDLK